MKRSPVELIKEQVNCLPEKDIKFAEKFINSRDFEALRDLVNSDVFLVERDTKINGTLSKYSNINIEKLNELKGTVDEYYNLLYPDIESLYDEYNINDNSEDSEW